MEALEFSTVAWVICVSLVITLLVFGIAFLALGIPGNPRRKVSRARDILDDSPVTYWENYSP